jgi:hypothetical protein
MKRLHNVYLQAFHDCTGTSPVPSSELDLRNVFDPNEAGVLLVPLEPYAIPGVVEVGNTVELDESRGLVLHDLVTA